MHLPVGDFPSHSKKYLLMTKNHRLKKEKRNLSLSEIFSYGVALAFDSKTYKEKGIELVDFTPQEIRDFALEMEESITSEKKPSQENEELQKKFKLLFASNIESYKKGKDITYLLHDKIRSRISVEFINKNSFENVNFL